MANHNLMLSKKAIDEFKVLYKKTYGEDLSDFLASEAANRLIRMYEAVYKPISQEQEGHSREIASQQNTTRSSQKIDFVKHLVQDAKLTQWKQENQTRNNKANHSKNV